MWNSIVTTKIKEMPTFSLQTLNEGTLTFTFWTVDLGFSSEFWTSSEKVSWEMRSTSLIKPHSTSESRISQKSFFSDDIASTSFLKPI